MLKKLDIWGTNLVNHTQCEYILGVSLLWLMRTIRSEAGSFLPSGDLKEIGLVSCICVTKV